MDNKFFKVYKTYFGKEIINIVILCLLIIIGIIAQSIIPYIYGIIIDFVTKSDLVKLKFYLILYFLLLTGISILSMVEQYLGTKLTAKLCNNIKISIFNKILSMKNKNIANYTIGELINHLEIDATTIVNFYLEIFTSCFMIIINLIISIYFIFKISTVLSTISIIFIPLSYIINILFKKKYGRIQIKQRNFNDKYSGFTYEIIHNIKGIKIFQLESIKKNQYISLIKESLLINLNLTFVNNIISFIKNFISNIFNITILFISSILISNNLISIGKLISFNTYLTKLHNAITKLLDIEINRQKLYVSLERLEKISNEEVEIDTINNINTDYINVEKIIFNNVKFAYDNDFVINGFCFECNSPGFYTIIGQNGSGKSTLFQLLTRLYDIDEGEIIINDKNIRLYSLNVLRFNISYMAKDNFFLNDSIFNNLILSNGNISYEEVVNVCKKVGLHNFILSLDHQYNTTLGSKGISLSSGQKQKLCLARILLRKTPILLLDEVTSDLDYESEMIILAIIKEIAKDALVFCISHSKLLAEESDKVIILKNGQIIQSGSHYELIKTNTFYKHLIECT